MKPGTERTSTSFSALYTGGLIGVSLGSAYLAMLTNRRTPLGLWVAASGYLLAGVLILSGAALLIGLPVWTLTRRRGLSARRRLVWLACAALGAGLILGIGVGVITGQVVNAVSVALVATLWCSVPAFALAGPLAGSVGLRKAILGSILLLTAAAAISLLVLP